MRILIVEDEEALANGLKFNFEQENYQVAVSGDGHSALEQFRNAKPPFDLVILDLMLPGMSGYETCRAIREIDTQVPVLVLSARKLSEDKTQAFDCGTDQYMEKPFALPELLARVRNLLERRNLTEANGSHSTPERLDVYDFGPVHIDFRTFEVTVDGNVHQLTTLERDLLRYFIENEGHVLSRTEILNSVWGEQPDIGTRSIDNFVMRLRKLLDTDVQLPSHILAVRGTGYRFVANPDSLNNDETAT